MTFDVVMVTHNSASHLVSALSALPEEAQVVVVDNASTDKSADVAESLGATVVRGTVNSGFAAGCNRGAALGNAKTILFLNPDAVISAESLDRLLTAMDDNPGVGVASPRLEHLDGHKQRVQWPYPTAAGAWREALGMAPDYDEASFGFVIGAVFAVRREAFEAVGGFDERFWLYGEEADLCKRIEDVGWSIKRIPAASATHIGGASGGGSPVQDQRIFEHFQRGGEHFVDKHGGKRALASYRTANLVGSLGRGVLGVGAISEVHRRRTARLVRSLMRGATDVALDSPATAAPDKGLVVCSLEAWNDVWRRNQFFVRELLAADPDLRVLFIEPAFDVVHEKRRGTSRQHKAGLRPLPEDGRIFRFEPVKWFPRKLGGAADQLRDAQVRDAVSKLGFVAPRLWVNDPSYATLADAVDWPAVYDITDDWTEVADTAEAAKVRAWENRLFKRSEAVSVCSSGLLESRRPMRDDLVLIPNAVDAQELQRIRPRPSDMPKGRSLVYVGTLHTDRLDVELAARMAREISDARVVLVGPDALDDRSRQVLDEAGVVRLGPRPYADVPGYLQHADVVVVPHVVSPFTESLDPIKLYECLAVGTPTVATPVAGFRNAGGPVVVAESEGFVDAVRGVLAERPDSTPQDMPSWMDRAETFGGMLDVAAAMRAADRPRAVRRHILASEPEPFRPRRLTRLRQTERTLVINGRFRQRAVTGVERYATELVARLPEGVPLLGPDDRFAHPPLGHVWEQTGLPLEVGRNQVLWSPCNTGPALMHNHIITVHDLSPIDHPEWFASNYGHWMRLLTRSLVEHSEHILVPSQFTRQRLVEVCGVREGKITVIPNGVSPSFRAGRSGLTDEQRAELGVPGGRYVLVLATVEPRKNLARVIEAFELVQRSHPDVSLVLAGSKGHASVFAHGAEAAKEPDCDLVRLGYVADTLIPRLYASASVFVYAPLYEGFGIPPLEAAAAGAPSVLSDIPPLRELGLTAAWVDPTDVESVAAGIACQLDQPVHDEQSADAVIEAFSWDTSAQLLIDTLGGLNLKFQ